MTVIYGSSVADATLTTACDMTTATGGTETSKQTTVTGGNLNAEVWSKGNASLASVSAIPATPTGNGWVYAPGAGIFATGNWSASCKLQWARTANAPTWTMRFFRYSGGVYTSIGTITINNTSGAITTYSFPATSMSSITFGASDLLYVDLWASSSASLATANLIVYESTSATAGVASDMQITTSSFSATTTSTRTIPATAALSLTSTRTIGSNTAALQATSTRTIGPDTAALLATLTRTISSVTAALLATFTRIIGPNTAAISQTSSRTISPNTAALQATNTRTIPATAALLAQRTIPASAALSTPDLTRTIPASCSLALYIALFPAVARRTGSFPARARRGVSS